DRVSTVLPTTHGGNTMKRLFAAAAVLSMFLLVSACGVDLDEASTAGEEAGGVTQTSDTKGDQTEDTTSEDTSEEKEDEKEAAPKGPEADVTVPEDCTVGEYEMIDLQGKVTNSADSTRSYLVTVEALNSKGDRVAELYGSVDALAPGQTANLDLGGFV